MTKRILASVMAIVTTVLCGSVATYAADPVKPGKVLVFQNFESDAESFLASGGGDLVVNKVTEEGNTYAELTTTTDKPFYRVGMTSAVPEDFVVMVDICKMSSPSLGWQFQVFTTSGTQVRWSYNASDMKLGKWYTYLITRKNGVLKHYRKEKGVGASFEMIAAGTSPQITGGSNAFIITFWTATGAETGGSYTTTKFLADNIVLYNGSFSDANSQKIEVTDIEDGKKISAEVDVYTDANLDEEMTVAPVMVVFDKKGKIMDWSPSTVTIGAAQNTVATEITMTDEYYEKVKGGVAELYLWTSETSFKPMMNGYRVTLD